MRNPRRAFTLVEVLAAMLFMSILIPVAVEGLLVCNRVSVNAQRKRDAAQLANEKLTGLIVDKTWTDGDQSGDFGDEWPGYRWELTTDSWTEDTMRVVTVTAYYQVQGQERSEQFSTLVEDATESEATK